MNELVQALDTVEALVGRSLSATKTACTGERGVSAAALDEYQQVTAELSVCTAEIQCARTYLAHVAAGSDFEQTLAATFCAEMLQNIRNRLARSPADFGLTNQDIDTLPMSACGDLLSTARLAALGQQVVERGGDLGHRGLDEEKLLMADTFRQFAEEVVKPLAEDIHRQDMIIPDEILEGVRELGCFGLSVPQRYGGLLPDDAEDSLGMIVVTEELLRASLGGAGSLITRPEIMARALMEGGTEEQKQHWLPRIAMGDPLCGIAITEPDYGSDVASMKLKATKTDDGWVLNGATARSTFAGKSPCGRTSRESTGSQPQNGQTPYDPGHN